MSAVLHFKMIVVGVASAHTEGTNFARKKTSIGCVQELANHDFTLPLMSVTVNPRLSICCYAQEGFLAVCQPVALYERVFLIHGLSRLFSITALREGC